MSSQLNKKGLTRRRITKGIYDKKHQERQEYQAAVVSVARRAKTIFENSSEPADKRAFLSFLLQNPTVNGKKLYFSIASPFNLVLELADSPNWLPWASELRTFFTTERVLVPTLC